MIQWSACPQQSVVKADQGRRHPKDLPHEGHLPPRHPDVTDNDSEAEISLNARSGTYTGETMRLISLCRTTLTSLVDSGSIHCFMAAQVAQCLNLTPLKDGMTVGVANGERLPCLGVCSVLSFSINDESFCIDCLIITLEGYEVVLRYN
jgi:hypothetical protein